MGKMLNYQLYEMEDTSYCRGLAAQLVGLVRQFQALYVFTHDSSANRHRIFLKKHIFAYLRAEMYSSYHHNHTHIKLLQSDEYQRN